MSEKYFPFWGILGSIAMALALFIPQIGYVGRFGEPYSMLNHFVSEMGEIGVSHLAMVFNVGIIIGGLLFIPFMIGLGLYLDTLIAKTGLVFGMLSSIFVSLVGMFPMNNLIPHFIVAMLYFNCALITVLLFTISILLTKEPKIPKWTSLMGIVVIVINAIALTAINPSDFDFESGTTIEGAFMSIMQDRPEVWSMAILEWAMVLSVLGYLFFTAAYVRILIKNK